VGVNGIGQAHLFALGREGAGVLTAVCDTDPERAEAAAARHGVPAHADAKALYASGDVDAVVVATPPATHGALVRDALDAGLHVYCEKPVTPTADEGYALARHARERGRVLQVGFQFRFHTGFAALRAAAAEIGPPTRVHLTATNWFRAQAYFEASPWRRTWAGAGGGVLMSQAIHQLDALVAVAGMPARVHGVVRCARHDAEVEDDAVALLEWASGATGVVTASLNDPAGTERLEVYGERGAATLTDGYTVRVARHAPVQQICDTCPDEFPELAPQWTDVDVRRAPSEWFDMLVAAHVDFAAAVRDGRAPVVDGEEGTRAVELANAIYMSAFAGEPVSLPLPRGEYPRLFEDLAVGAVGFTARG
jgi:predicted dehydrogenase